MRALIIGCWIQSTIFSGYITRLILLFQIIFLKDSDSMYTCIGGWVHKIFFFRGHSDQVGYLMIHTSDTTIVSGDITRHKLLFQIICLETDNGVRGWIHTKGF